MQVGLPEAEGAGMEDIPASQNLRVAVSARGLPGGRCRAPAKASDKRQNRRQRQATLPDRTGPAATRQVRHHERGERPPVQRWPGVAPATPMAPWPGKRRQAGDACWPPERVHGLQTVK